MQVRDFAASVGRVYHDTKRAYVCRRDIVEAHQHLKTLKQRRIQCDTLATIYNDRTGTLYPEWFTQPLHRLAPTDENAQRLNHAVFLYFEYYMETAKKESIDQEIRQTLVDQYDLIRNINDLRASIASSLAELETASAGITPDGPTQTIADILHRAHECLRDTARLDADDAADAADAEIGGTD